MFLALLLLTFFPVPALAHVTKADGDMKVMVHMDPDDEPIAGPPTTLHFLFRHAKTGFEMENCDCTVRIAPYKDLADIETKGDLIRLNETMREASGSRVYAITQSFPSKAVYAIVVEGKPLDTTAFAPFSITFDKRVDRSKSVLTTPSTIPIGHVMIGAGLVLLIALVWQFSRRQRPV